MTRYPHIMTTDTLIPIDMAERTRFKASMVFNFQGHFTHMITVQAGGNSAVWIIEPTGHRHVRFVRGDSTLKPKNCDGAANYIRHYVRTHAASFETLLKP